MNPLSATPCLSWRAQFTRVYSTSARTRSSALSKPVVESLGPLSYEQRDLSCPIVGAASHTMEHLTKETLVCGRGTTNRHHEKGHGASISHTVRCAWHQKGRSERQSWKGQEPRRANPAVIWSPVTGSPSHKWRRTAIRYLCRLHHTRQVVAHGGCAWRRMA